MNDVKSDGRKPVLQALLLADQVYQDKNTGKYIVAGIFGRLYVMNQATPPGEEKSDVAETKTSSLSNVFSFQKAGSPYVYINLVEVHKVQDFLLRCVSLEDQAIKFECKLQINHDSLLTNCEVAVPLPPLPQKKGIYAIELLWHNEEPLGSVRIVVEEMPPGEHP